MTEIFFGIVTQKCKDVSYRVEGKSDASYNIAGHRPSRTGDAFLAATQWMGSNGARVDTREVVGIIE